MSSVCVYCNSPDNLNTCFNIKLEDGEQVSVYICDTHAEEATAKSIKQAYESRQQKLEEIMRQARAMGFDIAVGNQNLSLVTAPEKQKTQLKRQEATIAAEHNNNALEGESDIINSSKLDSISNRQQAKAIPQSALISMHSAHSIGHDGNQLLNGEVKPMVVEGIAGTQLIVPAIKVDGTGTTQITIKKNNPFEFDKRFKKMAAESEKGNVPSFANGYNNAQRTCPMCRGTGETRVTGKTGICEVCGGTGFTSVY